MKKKTNLNYPNFRSWASLVSLRGACGVAVVSTAPRMEQSKGTKIAQPASGWRAKNPFHFLSECSIFHNFLYLNNLNSFFALQLRKLGQRMCCVSLPQRGKMSVAFECKKYNSVPAGRNFGYKGLGDKELRTLRGANLFFVTIFYRYYAPTGASEDWTFLLEIKSV